MQKLLAFDYSACCGRAILGIYDGERLQLEEIYRFSNEPVLMNGTLYWDICRLMHELKRGIAKCNNTGNDDLSSIGVDTWGVDFGLLGQSDDLLGNPVHYRDQRTDGMMKEAFLLVPKRAIYQNTGTQFLHINTLYQLLSMKMRKSSLLEKAKTLLMMPDLLNFFLTGEKASEFSISSTTQMLDWSTKEWSRELLNKLDIPTNILQEIVMSGSVIGKVSKKVCEELGISRNIPVVAVTGHDTECALMAVPANSDRFAYLNSGAWAQLGMELFSPVINNKTYDYNFTNEAGYGGTVSLHKNIMGLWIYHECKRAWEKEWITLSYDQLENEAMESAPFNFFIDPDDESFLLPGNMPEKIKNYCIRTEQKTPKNVAEVVRCIMESLAMKYRWTLEALEDITGLRIPVLHIIGVGCKNRMLCQFASNAIGKSVISGPVTAAAIGNLICQMLAREELGSLHEARSMVKRSFPTTKYLPNDCKSWSDAYVRFVHICKISTL